MQEEAPIPPATPRAAIVSTTVSRPPSIPPKSTLHTRRPASAPRKKKPAKATAAKPKKSKQVAPEQDEPRRSTRRKIVISYTVQDVDDYDDSDADPDYRGDGSRSRKAKVTHTAADERAADMLDLVGSHKDRNEPTAPGVTSRQKQDVLKDHADGEGCCEKDEGAERTEVGYGVIDEENVALCKDYNKRKTAASNYLVPSPATNRKGQASNPPGNVCLRDTSIVGNHEGAHEVDRLDYSEMKKCVEDLTAFERRRVRLNHRGVRDDSLDDADSGGRRTVAKQEALFVPNTPDGPKYSVPLGDIGGCSANDGTAATLHGMGGDSNGTPHDDHTGIEEIYTHGTPSADVRYRGTRTHAIAAGNPTTSNSIQPRTATTVTEKAVAHEGEHSPSENIPDCATSAGHTSLINDFGVYTSDGLARLPPPMKSPKHRFPNLNELPAPKRVKRD